MALLLLSAILLALGGQALAAWLGLWAGSGLLGLLLFGGALLLDRRLRRLSNWVAAPKGDAPPPLGWLGRAWPNLAGLAQESMVLRQQLSECEILLEQYALAQGQEEAQRLEALNAMAQRIEREAAQLIAEMAESASDLGQLTDEVELSTGRVEQQAMAASTEADNSAQAADAAAERTAHLADAVGRIAQQISRAAEATRSIADRSRHTRDMFNELEGIIEKIGEVSRLIHEIAGQTNLLALNATIEAARAGEAGKGFAVVASEVKTLAGRTAHATTEIAERLGLIQRQAEQVTVSMDSIGTSITELDEVATTVAEAMSEQAVAVNEIAQAVSAAASSARQAQEQVAGASREIDDNRMSVGMMHSASGQVLATMDGLQSRLDIVVESAVSAIRYRPSARGGLDLPAILQGVAASALPVLVVSLDPLGASLRMEQTLPRGSHGILEVPGLPPVPFRVVGQGGVGHEAVTRLALLQGAEAGSWRSSLGAYLAKLDSEAA